MKYRDVQIFGDKGRWLPHGRAVHEALHRPRLPYGGRGVGLGIGSPPLPAAESHPAMLCLDLTLPSPEANLACDEALLEACESGEGAETLRFWEPPLPFVVMGYSNHAAREVDLLECQRRGVPVLRRCTGGGTVLQGPGCLNYALCLRTARPELGTITAANRAIMEKHRDVFARWFGAAVTVEGHTDLALNGQKFSGNAQRRKRDFLLFHGSILLHLDLALVEDLLPAPSKQPAYRHARKHTEFLCNVLLPAPEVRAAIKQAWGAEQTTPNVPGAQIERLVEQKYSRPEWNLR